MAVKNVILKDLSGGFILPYSTIGINAWAMFGSTTLADALTQMLDKIPTALQVAGMKCTVKGAEGVKTYVYTGAGSEGFGVADNWKEASVEKSYVDDAVNGVYGALAAQMINNIAFTSERLNFRSGNQIVVSVPYATGSNYGIMTSDHVYRLGRAAKMYDMGHADSLSSCDDEFINTLNSAEVQSGDFGYCLFVIHNDESYQDVYYFVRYNADAYNRGVVRFHGGDIAKSSIPRNAVDYHDFVWEAYATSGDVSQLNSALVSLQGDINSCRSDLTAAQAQININETNIGTKASNADLMGLLAARYATVGAVGEMVGDNLTWKMHADRDRYLVSGLTTPDMEKICGGPDFNVGGSFIGAMPHGKTNRPVSMNRVTFGDTQSVSFRGLADGNTSLRMFYIPRAEDVDPQYEKWYKVNDMEIAFQNCSNLNTVKYLDVSQCNNFTGAFENCGNLEEVWLRGVNSMLAFNGCEHLLYLYIMWLSADLDVSEASGLRAESLLWTMQNAANMTSVHNLYISVDAYRSWGASIYHDIEVAAEAHNFNIHFV